MGVLARSGPAIAQEAAVAGIASSPFLDRRPLSVRADDSAADVLSDILADNAWGAAVIDDRGRYVGMCTLRSLADLVLLASADSDTLTPAFDYHRDDAERMAARLGEKGGLAASMLLDRTVPVLRGSQSLPQLLATLIHRPPVAAVVDDAEGTLLGIVSLERAMRALHARSGLAARRPA